MKKYTLCLGVLLLGLAGVQAQETSALQLSIVPVCGLHPNPETVINGVSLNIWGQNPQRALALGLVNGSTGDSGGLSLGALNYADNYSGVQLGAVNVVKGDFKGLQLGAVNWAESSSRSWQLGAINVCKDCQGLQLGAINYCESMRGLQIGALNLITKSEWFAPKTLGPAFPIINWSF